MGSPSVTSGAIAERALGELLGLAGREAPDFVSIDAGAPVLATHFYAEEACAAVLAATGVMAAEIWRLRGGGAQLVSVSTREAAAALNCARHNRFEGEAPGLAREGRTPADGFFSTKDGRWVYLHPGFPGTSARLHALMGSPDDRDGAADAARMWDAPDLEAAIAEAGACGAMARTPQEWDSDEQGRLLAAAPVVEIIRIGDSPPEALRGGGATPLGGVRTLDLTRVLAGPTCARTLTHYGSETLHIASPGLPSIPAFVADTNHGKLSAWLDLTQDGDRARLEGLVRQADVFSQGYRAGALGRLGFGPADLARLRPGIIYLDINAYGHEGPWRDRRGWEQLAQTVTGMAVIHGGVVGPQLQPGAVNDYTTGFLAALGGLIALERRARWGGSYLVRASLARTAMWVRSLGLAEPDRPDRAAPLTEDELEGWRQTSRTDFGVMRHLRPPVLMSATPARWVRPVVRLGAHLPEWPA